MFFNRKFIYTFAGVLFWAINIIVARLLFSSTTINTYTVVLWTTGLAIPYWLYILYRRKEYISTLGKNDYGILIAIGLINGVLVAIIEILALQYSSAINYAFLIRTVSIFAIVFAAVLLKEKLTFKKLLLISFIMVGSYFVTAQDQKIVLSWGDIFTLMEAILLVFGNNILGKKIVHRIDPQLSAAISFLIGAMPVIIISLLLGGGNLSQGWFLVVLLTGTYILIRQFRFIAQRLASVSYFTMMFSFTPVLVMFFAILVLGEPLSYYQIIGGIFIVSVGVLVEKLNI